MLYFFDFTTAQGHVRDPEGTEFADDAAARLEAVDCARQLAAEALRHGLPLSKNSRIEIVDGLGRELGRVSIIEAVFADDLKAFPIGGPAAGKPTPHDYTRQFVQTKQLFEQTRALVGKARATCEEIRKGVAALG